MQPKAVAFVKSLFDAGKPVAVICYGPWTVIGAGAARGRRIASWPSPKTDLRNAGAEWMDAEAVADGYLVSSRRPSDIPAFNRAMIELFVLMYAPMRRTPDRGATPAAETAGATNAAKPPALPGATLAAKREDDSICSSATGRARFSKGRRRFLR
jgi:hypothetical protein